MNPQLYHNAVAFISRLDRRSKWTRYVGWVYALRNREFRKPLLKIGMTTTSPHQRAHELGSATGVPGRFDLVYFVHTVNCAVAEHYVHQKLASYRTTGEFFEVPIPIAVDAMDEAAAMYPIAVGLGGRKRAGWGDEWLPRHSAIRSAHALTVDRRTRSVPWPCRTVLSVGDVGGICWGECPST